MTKLYSKSTRHVWIVQYASYICPCMQPKFLSTVAVVNISAMVVFMRWLRKHMGEVEWVVKLHRVEFMGIHLAAAQVKRMIMDWNVLGIGHIWMDFSGRCIVAREEWMNEVMKRTTLEICSAIKACCQEKFNGRKDERFFRENDFALKHRCYVDMLLELTLVRSSITDDVRT